MTDKLAEEILKNTFNDYFLDLDYLELYIEAMQAYHEAKLKEVTDENMSRCDLMNKF